jgi:hypothetical protein
VIEKISNQVMIAANMGDNVESTPYNYQVMWADLDGPLGLIANGNDERGRGRSRSPVDRKGANKRINGSTLSSKSQPRSSKAGSSTSNKEGSGRDVTGRNGSSGSRDPSADSKGSDRSVFNLNLLLPLVKSLSTFLL